MKIAVISKSVFLKHGAYGGDFLEIFEFSRQTNSPSIVVYVSGPAQGEWIWREDKFRLLRTSSAPSKRSNPMEISIDVQEDNEEIITI